MPNQTRWRRWVYDLAEDVTGAGLTEHGAVYSIFNGILRENVLPPELEAAIYRALKDVPGVTVDTVEIFGRPALALAQERLVTAIVDEPGERP